MQCASSNVRASAAGVLGRSTDEFIVGLGSSVLEELPDMYIC
jgi:hypothetical protein